MGASRGKRAGTKGSTKPRADARPRPAREMVRCPTCGAPPGTSCNSADGGPHKERSLLRSTKTRATRASELPVTNGMEADEANAVDSVPCPKCGASAGELCSGGETHPGRLGAFDRAMDLARRGSRGKARQRPSGRSAATKPKSKKRRKGQKTSTLRTQPYQGSKTSNSKRKRLKSNPRTSPRPSVSLRTGKR